MLNDIEQKLNELGLVGNDDAHLRRSTNGMWSEATRWFADPDETGAVVIVTVRIPCRNA